MTENDKLSDRVDEDIAGVQGEEPEAADAPASESTMPGGGTEVEAPDGAEIEWAGRLVKKAPGTAADPIG